MGVSQYDNPKYGDLAFPAYDVESLANALLTQSGGLYSDVGMTILQNPKREEVFERLSQLKKITTSGDVSIIYFSGHGIIDVKREILVLNP